MGGGGGFAECSLCDVNECINICINLTETNRNAVQKRVEMQVQTKYVCECARTRALTIY